MPTHYILSLALICSQQAQSGPKNPECVLKKTGQAFLVEWQYFLAGWPYFLA